jgi:ribonuclease J
VSTSEIKILPIGGLGEIGMNCMVIEYEDEILVIDCGLLFTDLDHFGVDFVVSDFAYLVERKDKVKAVLLTHGHEDHIGALPFLMKAGIRAPIYASPFTMLLVRERLREAGWLDRAQLCEHALTTEIDLKCKYFKARSIAVNHSIVEAASLAIETPLGLILHTGDFRIDSDPFYGKPLDLDVFRKLGQDGVLLLMSDSTNVERCEHGKSESTVHQKLEELLARAEGLTVVSMFASNIGRMGQVFSIAKKMNKRVAACGRSMEQNIQHAFKAGYLRGAETQYISQDQISEYARKDVIVLATGSQGEPRSALTRMSRREHPEIKFESGDRVILSSKFIPGNEKAIGRSINDLFRQGADVIYEAIEEVHVSGHATRPELRQMIEAVKPRFFVPIHGEYRHLVHHAALARECGIPEKNVVLAVNGDLLALTQNDLWISGQLPEGRVMVENREGQEISKTTLKERRQLAETGVVISVALRDKRTGELVSDPVIVAKGLAHETVEAWVLDEARAEMKEVLQGWEEEWDQALFHPQFQEQFRVELRRFMNTNLGKKPVVIPIVLDV